MNLFFHFTDRTLQFCEIREGLRSIVQTLKNLTKINDKILLDSSSRERSLVNLDMCRFFADFIQRVPGFEFRRSLERNESLPLRDAAKSHPARSAASVLMSEMVSDCGVYYIKNVTLENAAHQ